MAKNPFPDYPVTRLNDEATGPRPTVVTDEIGGPGSTHRSMQVHGMGLIFPEMNQAEV